MKNIAGLQANNPSAGEIEWNIKTSYLINTGVMQNNIFEPTGEVAGMMKGRRYLLPVR